MLTFRYRLYPSKEQIALLWNDANRLNKLYNDYLNKQIKNYEQNKKFLDYKILSQSLTSERNSDPSLNVIYSQVAQQALRRLKKSFSNFYRMRKIKKGKGFPNFRSCKNFFGITYPQSGYKLDNCRFITTRYGSIPFIEHRLMLGNIRQITITTDGEKWFICVTTDASYHDNSNNPKDVGIDLGLINLVTTSDGLQIKNNRKYRWYDKQIAKLQERKSTLKKGSIKFKKFGRIIKKLYGAKSRQRRDYLHKVSKRLSSIYDTIYLEDLSLKEMSESKKTGLNKSLRDSSLAILTEYIKYKTNNVILVNPAYTSKTCSVCGAVNKGLVLRDRVFKCNCGYEEDRDINASKNIECLGKAIVVGANPLIEITALYIETKVS